MRSSALPIIDYGIATRFYMYDYVLLRKIYVHITIFL